MRITVDTNVVIRFLIADDARQHALAQQAMETADALVFPIVTLCETVWVLERHYRLARAEIISMLRALIETETAEFDRPAVEAGLLILEAGGDFSDGVIAHLGRMNGSDVFVTFDRKAVRLLGEAGQAAQLLA